MIYYIIVNESIALQWCDMIVILYQITWFSWWRHQMETISASLAIFAGNSPVTSEFPAQRPVTRSFDVFFDLRLNKRLSKQWWDWWFKMPSSPLWCHCNVLKSKEHQRSSSLIFVKQIHRWPLNSPHKWPSIKKVFSFDEIIIAMWSFKWYISMSFIFLDFCTIL